MNINGLIRWLPLAITLIAAQVGMAQAPAGAPAGATGLCKDGTYSTAASKRGACSGHKGVKEWYASGGKSAAAAPSDETSAPAKTSSPSPSVTPKTESPKESAPATVSSKTRNETPAPGGGADKVWLNTSSKVYHCPGTRYYGTTKAGAYISEAEAKEKGGRPDHGKPCK
jgi:hypothetical protein